MLILTTPGERIMLPDFGVGLHQYLFEQQDQRTYAHITSGIIDQVSKYMPFVLIDDVEITSGTHLWRNSGDYIMLPPEQRDDLSDNSLQIRVAFTVESLNLTSILNVLA